jgi:predicted TIM-barrel enzyme
MDRAEFHRLFKVPGPAVLPVIHVLDTAQTLANVRIAIEAGAQGVFLINHDFGIAPFLPLIEGVRARHPGLWLGVNFLAVTGKDAFPVLGRLAREGIAIDAYWADDARIDERRAAGEQPEAEAIAQAREESGWKGLYFGGTAFKKQRPVAPADYENAAAVAASCLDVVTTSGPATGEAADAGKVEVFRRGAGRAALALASGVTPDNAPAYAADVDAFLVATGINREGDFYHIDAGRLGRLLEFTRRYGASS